MVGGEVVKPWEGTVERSNRKKAARHVLVATAVKICRRVGEGGQMGG